jgi:hypothetical protein
MSLWKKLFGGGNKKKSHKKGDEYPKTQMKEIPNRNKIINNPPRKTINTYNDDTKTP